MVSVRHASFAFCAVTQSARIAAGYTQAAIAEKLEIPRLAYQTYETRTPLPHHLILRFCELTKISLNEFFNQAKDPTSIPTPQMHIDVVVPPSVSCLSEPAEAKAQKQAQEPLPSITPSGRTPSQSAPN